MRVPRSFRRGVMAIALAVHGPWVHAADIEWRGGFGDNFAETRNWHLPPDIPPATPPDQRENFRRVPGTSDRAIVGSGFTVRVTRAAAVQAVAFGGKLVVDGAAAAFATRDAGGAADDTFGEIEVLNRGRLQTGNRATFNGPVHVESGGLVSIARGGVLDHVTVVGQPFLPTFAATGFGGGPDAAHPVVIRQLLVLSGDPGTVVALHGFIQVEKEATWQHCRVDAGVVTIRPPAGGEPGARLRLQQGDADTVWTTADGGELVFAANARLVHGTGLHRFSGKVHFQEGSLGIPEAPAEAGPIVFDGGTQQFDHALSLHTGSSAMELHGPVAFAGNAQATFNRSAAPAGLLMEWKTSPGPLGIRRGIEFRGNARGIFRVSVAPAGLVVDDTAAIVIEPPNRLIVSGVDNEAGEVSRVQMRGGRITAQPDPGGGVGGAEVVLSDAGILTVGRTAEFTAVPPAPAFSGRLKVERGAAWSSSALPTRSTCLRYSTARASWGRVRPCSCGTATAPVVAAPGT